MEGSYDDLREPQYAVCDASGRVVAYIADSYSGYKMGAVRLLAAAPELLEALENIENDGGSIPEEIWKMRNAAITKARGW